MTEQDRMKELMKRMVAMSPEPPNFPEEVTLVNPKQSRQMSPALVFAGGAALVIAIALPIILLVRPGGGDEPAGTTLPLPVSTTQPEATPSTTLPQATTTTPESTTTVPVMSMHEVVVYLSQAPENSFQGNPAIVPFKTMAEGLATAGDLEISIRTLTRPGLIAPPGNSNVMSGGVELLGLEVDDADDPRLITLDMNEKFVQGAGGLLLDTTMLNELIYTATQFSPEAKVIFTAAGRPIDAFGSEGIDLTQPVDRDTFLDSLNLIFLTEPIILGGDELPMVAGRANVFEAALTVRIIDEETGATLYEVPVQATSGSGTWGTFSVSLDTAQLTSNSLVRVFWYSAKDGEPADVVTVPVSEGPFDLASQ